MLAIIVGSLVWLPALIGWGTPTFGIHKYLLGVDKTPALEVGEVLLGLAIVANLAVLVNFVVPLNAEIVVIMLGLGWGLWVWWVWRYGLPRFTVGQIIVGSVLALGAAFIAASPITDYDTGLYHLQALSWLKQSATPFGLANLHGRLGFNSLWLPLAAVVDLPFGATVSLSAVLVAALLVWGWSVLVAAAVVQWVTTAKPGGHTLFLALAPVAFMSTVLMKFIPSPSADLPVFLLTFILVALALQADPASPNFLYHLWIVAVGTLWAVTLKLSAVPLLLLPLVLWIKQLRQRASSLSRKFLRLSALSVLLLLGPWLARSLVLSGCFVYPVNATCIHTLPWTPSPSQVTNEAESIQSWARAPGLNAKAVLANWNWLGNWSKAMLGGHEEPRAVLSLIGLGVCLLCSVRYKRSPEFLTVAFLPLDMIVVIGVGVCYWFITAPNLRFGGGYLWALCCLILSAAIHHLTLSRQFTQRLVWQAVHIVFITIIGIVMVFGLMLTFYVTLSNIETYSQIWLYPSSIPTVPVEVKRTAIDFLINVPRTTDQCWATPLPCTPYFNEQLRLAQDASGQYRAFYPPLVMP